MIEEIKKLINNQLLSNTNYTHFSDEDCLKNILEILDKYNNQSNYKSAWNRLKERNLLLRTPNMRLLTHEMEELEQKYNLGGH